MHDIKSIRENPQALDEAMAKRNLPAQSEAILVLDKDVRALKTQEQEWQSEKNKYAKEIGFAKSKGDNKAAEELLQKQKLRNDIVQANTTVLAQREESLNDVLSALPNTPADDVPVGKDETGNKEIRVHGSKPTLSFKPKEHFDLGEKLGLMDFERAAKISGARFVVLKGQLARLERALASFMLDIHTKFDPQNDKTGRYTEVVPPLLVKSDTMYGTAQLPKFEQELFATKTLDVGIFANKTQAAIDEFLKNNTLDKNNLIDEFSKTYIGRLAKLTHEELLKEFGTPYYLIPTAEVPLTNLVNNEIINEAELPLRFTAYTPCFRSEAGSAGKDTRGMIRQHQFSKVELVSIVHPDASPAEHERMTNCAEEILKRLDLHYRVILLCTGDMGFAAKKTYDIEVWLPGQNAYREISSCSNCGDFQARRMKARFKGKDSKNTQFVHTLNGSGLPIGRTMVAILENYQQEDGSITIPEALRPYMDNASVIK